jgi:hypothetical protein
MNKHFLRDTNALLGRSLRHILRSPDTIITIAITAAVVGVAMRSRALAGGVGR